VVDKIRAALVRRVLDLLEGVAKDRPDDYQRFWMAFGQVLKEGLVEDMANRERIAKLCRFRSTQELEQPKVSLEDYVARMKEDQTGIFYIAADHPNVARSSPHLEGYASRGYEVLFLTDPVDEWWVLQFSEFAGKHFISVARGAAEFEAKVETAEEARAEAAFGEVLPRLAQHLTGKISAARLSKRLTESPACLVLTEHGMSRRLDELLRNSGRVSGPTMHPILELNSKHPLIERLQKAGESEFADLAELLYGQALLAEGGQLEDPAGFVKRLNRILLGDSARSSIILT
jgi:molecular chaperone HtpG